MLGPARWDTLGRVVLSKPNQAVAESLVRRIAPSHAVLKRPQQAVVGRQLTLRAGVVRWQPKPQRNKEQCRQR